MKVCKLEWGKRNGIVVRVPANRREAEKKRIFENRSQRKKEKVWVIEKV